MKGKKIGLLWINYSKQGYIYESGSIEIDGKKYQIEVYDTKKKGKKSADKTIHLKYEVKK